MQKLNDMKNLLAELEVDFIKFYEKKNAAAGTRIRKGMQNIKKLAQEIRVDVQAAKSE